MTEINTNNRIIDFLLNKTIQSFDNSHYVSNNKINYYQFNKIIDPITYPMIDIDNITPYNLDKGAEGNFYYNDSRNILKNVTRGIQEYRENDILYFRKYNKLKMTKISSKKDRITYGAFNNENVSILTNIVPEHFNKNIEYIDWKAKNPGITSDKFISPYKINIELIDKVEGDNIFYDLYGNKFNNLNKSYFDYENGVLYIHDNNNTSSNSLINNNLEVYISFFQFAFNVYGYYPDNYAIRNIYKNNKYDDHSINISRNITLGNDYNEKDSLEIHGNIHISKNSDLVHDNYRLNQIAYDNSDNFHLIDRQFMKIEDIILGYNSSIIKTKFDYFSCGNNEFGQMGMMYDSDLIFTEFKKNKYLRNIKKISIGKENIGYIDYDNCLYIAGSNRYGQLGLNLKESEASPKFLKISHCYQYKENIDISFENIIAGQNCFYLRDSDNKHYYCGYNSRSKQDIRSKYYSTITNILINTDNIKIKHIFPSKYLRTNMSYSCLFVTDIFNNVYGCGNNEYGQLGLENTVNQLYLKKINLSNIKKVSCGYQFTFFLDYSGNLYASGRNVYGVFGIGTTLYKYISKPVLVNTDVEKVDCGSRHVVIIKNSKLYSCGYNNFGQLGLGNTDNIDVFSEITLIDRSSVNIVDTSNINIVDTSNINIVDIKCSNTFSSFFIDNYGYVYSCGLGINMILGHGDSNSYTIPLWIENLENIITISLDYNHVVALDSSGFIYVAGRNEYGQCGMNNFITNYSSFIKIQDISNVLHVETSWLNTMILTNDNCVYVTGDNGYGQMGNNLPNEKYSSFQKITKGYLYDNIADISDINLCDGRMTVLTIDNKMYSCGNNMNGYLGLGDSENKFILHQHINYYNNENKLHILPKIKSINETKSMTHNIFMDVSNNVFGIGSNQYGQMGNNNNIPIYTQSVNYNNYNILDGYNSISIKNYITIEKKYPIKLDISNVLYCAVGNNTTIILKNDYKLYGCGDSRNNELGLYYMGQYNNFTLITDIKQIEIENISFIYNSDETSFIINNENEIFVMGDNRYGQLGLGNTINTYEFSNMNNKINYQSISNSGNSFIILDINNNIYVCGDNRYGQLGIKNNDMLLNKTKVSEYICHYGYLDIFFKYDTLYITVKGGKMYGMGNNNNMLGLDSEYLYEPYYIKQISDQFNVEKCSMGKEHVLVLTTGNVLFACGKNNYGQLGLGHNNNEFKYILVDTIDYNKTILDIECGEYFSVILFDDNTIYVCGDNRYGQLGLNTFDIQSINTFTLVNINHIIKIGVGNNHLCVLSKNKDVYTCGDNRYGQLGLQHSNNVNVLTKIDIQESIFYGLFEFKYNKDFYEIYIGFNSSFFKDNNGFLFACGKNDYGQLGLDNSNEVIYPTIITFNFNIKNIIVGDDFTYFHEFFTGYNSTLANQDIQSGNYDINNTDKYFYIDNRIYVCGKNDYGQLGLGHNNDVYVPSINNFFNGKSIFKIKCGTNNVYYIDNDNRMYSTGINSYNILHHTNYNGVTNNSNTFKEFLNNQNTDSIIVKKILNTKKNSFLIDDEGYLYVCGKNEHGQLGINDISSVDIFFQNENISNVLNISSDGDSTILVTSNNELYVCGKNDYGQLGISNNYIDISLTQINYIDNTSGYSNIYTKHGYSYIITNNNTIYSSGKNDYGQLNTGFTNNLTQFTKTQFSLLNDISSNDIVLSLGKNHVLLMRVIRDISNIVDEDGLTTSVEISSYSLYGCGSNEHRQILDTSDNKYVNFMSMNIENLNGLSRIYASNEYNTVLDLDGYLYGNGIDNSLNSISYVIDNNIIDNVNIIETQNIDISLNKFKIFNTKITTNKPLPLIKNVIVGYSTTIITDFSNEIYCFGYNENGQSTLGHSNIINVITNITKFHNFKIKKIQMMNNTHTFLLTQDNDLIMYGVNNDSLFGTESLGELYLTGFKLENKVNYYNNIYTNNNLNIDKLYVNGIQYQSSDKRIKKNIVDISSELAYELLTNIETKYYQYVDESKGTDNVIGFIAQEVEKTLPVAVKTVKSVEKIYDKDLGYREIEIQMKKLDKTKIFAIHSDVIKKLTIDISNQQKELDDLEKEIIILEQKYNIS